MNYVELIDLIHSKNLDADLVPIHEAALNIVARRDPDAYEQIIEQIESLAYSISTEEAENIVRDMRPYGQMWSMAQVENMMNEHGVSGRVTDWYLVINMCYNDYYSTAKNFGIHNDENFYFCLAKDFIEDPDAKPHKVSKYFE